MLAALRLVVEQCDIAGIPLSLCGEMAGKPLDAMALVGIGFRSLSMSPPSVGPVKTMLRSLDVGRLREYLLSLGKCSSHSVRDRLRAFAKDHSILI
jgi:phosphotransferase system enzyme I (PtsP)